MKDLEKYMKESLLDDLFEGILDDDDDFLDRMDDGIYTPTIFDPDSPFRSEFICYDFSNKMSARRTKMDGSKYENGDIYISSMHVEHSTNKPLSSFFPKVNKLICVDYNNTARNIDIDDKSLAKDIVCTCFKTQMALKISNINIEINPQLIKSEFSKGNSLNLMSKCVFNNVFGPVELNNVDIQYVGQMPDYNKVICFEEMPIFKNVSGNARRISIYDALAWDEDVDKIFNIFEWPHKAIIRDHKIGDDKEVVIKSLKKAKSIANNQKRYTPVTQIFKLKNGAKLSDIIDISKLKDLDTLSYRDNNVSLVFQKNKSEYIPSMMTCEPEPLKKDTYQVTADGYMVFLEKYD